MKPDQLYTVHYKTEEHAWFKAPTELQTNQTTLSRTITMYLFGEGKSPSNGDAPEVTMVMDETVSSITFHPIVFDYNLKGKSSGWEGGDPFAELTASEKTFKQPFSDELIRAWMASVASRFMKESYMGDIILPTLSNLNSNGYEVSTVDLIRLAVQDETVVRPYSVKEIYNPPQQRRVDLYNVAHYTNDIDDRRPGVSVQNPLRELKSLISKDAAKYGATPTVIHFKRTPSHPGQMDITGYYEILVAYDKFESDAIKQMVDSAITIFTGNNDPVLFNDVRNAFYTIASLGRGVVFLGNKKEAADTVHRVARLLLTFAPSKLVEHLQLADYEYKQPKTSSGTLHNALCVAVTALCNVLGQPDTIEFY